MKISTGPMLRTCCAEKCYTATSGTTNRREFFTESANPGSIIRVDGCEPQSDQQQKFVPLTHSPALQHSHSFAPKFPALLAMGFLAGLAFQLKPVTLADFAAILAAVFITLP